MHSSDELKKYNQILDQLEKQTVELRNINYHIKTLKKAASIMALNIAGHYTQNIEETTEINIAIRKLSAHIVADSQREE